MRLQFDGCSFTFYDKDGHDTYIVKGRTVKDRNDHGYLVAMNHADIYCNGELIKSYKSESGYMTKTWAAQMIK